MFNGNFKEGIEQCASFPEDDPLIWKFLIGWVYRGTLEQPNHRPTNLVYDKIKIFALAEKYNIIKLKDQTMDTLNAHLCSQNLIPSLGSIALGYKLTQSGSKLRIFLAGTLAYVTLRRKKFTDGQWETLKVAEKLKTIEDLLEDTLYLMGESSGKLSPDPTKQPACDYHQHAKTEACPYVKK
jgi:hypothetical protein